MLSSYIHTTRSLNNFRGIKHDGVGMILPYYRTNVKGEKNKHLTVITGIKKDIEINIADINTNSDIYRLFYFEKEEEIAKRWKTELGETLLKTKAENFRVNWANLNNWQETQADAAMAHTLQQFNRTVVATRRFYFRGLVPFSYNQTDGPYGNFAPILYTPRWQFNWGTEAEPIIKLYGQTQTQALIPNEYNQSIQIGSIQLYRGRLLLPISKPKHNYNKYKQCLNTVRQTWHFYDLFKLQLYKFWRHDGFEGGQAKGKFKRNNLVWWRKRPRFQYKPTYIHFTDRLFRNNRPFYIRYRTAHEFVLKATKRSRFSTINEQQSTLRIATGLNLNAILWTPSKLIMSYSNQFSTVQSRSNFIEHIKKIKLYKSFDQNLKLCVQSAWDFNTFGFNVPTSRQKSLLSPILERYWPKIIGLRFQRKAFPRYSRKFHRRFLGAPLNYKARMQVQTLSEGVVVQFERLHHYLLKTVLLLVVGHQKLAKLATINIPKFEPIISFIAAGALRRQNFGQAIRIVFNSIFNFLFPSMQHFKKRTVTINSCLPAQLINSFVRLNNLSTTMIDFQYTFLQRALVALESLLPVELLPLFPFIGTHSSATIAPLEIDTRHFKMQRSDSNLYAQFIGSFGFRYYYADRLTFALRTSLQFKPTFELNSGKTLIIGSIANKLLTDVRWLRGPRKRNFYRELSRQQMQKQRFSPLFQYHF
jgi:hypothetical protein